MSKHTPGPWTVHWPTEEKQGQKLVIHAAGEFSRRPLALVEPVGDDYSHANAHLIAAAPEMLEIMRDTLDLIDAPVPLPFVTIRKITPEQANQLYKRLSEVIAKAEGRK